jgi:hypothetical protein
MFKKGDLYSFKLELQKNDGAPSNIFLLVTHFVDPEDGQEKLVLRDSGTTDALIANADDMDLVKTSFEEKLIYCLTDIGESLRMIAQTSEMEVHQQHDMSEEQTATNPKKKNIH